ncbi:MAG TPA: hypothetical protein VMT50_08000 [Steroidobacteraceae bacterium]|nr:hypothetical protein [Steroidobacteraceae bacterium]
MAQRTFFGTVRLAVLLAVLLFVAVGAWLDHSHTTSWTSTLRVTVYPVAADDDPGTLSYVASLDETSFEDTTQYFVSEAHRYGLALAEPVRVRVSHAAPGTPPPPPASPGPLSIALWSLHLRYWAARVQANDPLPPPDVQVFAIFHGGAGGRAVPDSLGLSKGLMAVAHLYAGDRAAGSNQVVLAHELLHTLGATDKYDPATGQPRDPDGLGDPQIEPRYPQRTAELMAGRIAISPRTAAVPESLRVTSIGPLTAREIGWVR